VISVDEMTGVQALERKYPTKPVRSGQVEKVEFEYKRHGTQSLIGNFEVATGKVIFPYINATRSEVDFVQNIKNVIAHDPEGQWIFIVDQLNTHKSESLVKLVAEQCGIEVDLGKKSYKGILKSKKSREEFLSDPNHRIRFVYTPKHTSWMNQIEIWFSILMRRLIKRSSFASIQDLKNRILKFIDYYNVTAKAFRWTYSGKPLAK
jgi:transposase